MSEYQYYGFRSIETSLSQQQRQELREISSRAHITSSSFTNTYNYGDLKADPLTMMSDFFDVGLYMSSWGQMKLFIKIPCSVLSEDLLFKFHYEYVLDYHADGSNWIITLSLPDGEEYYVHLYGLLDQEGEYLDDLIELRNEIISGDYRCFTLAWLPLLACEQVEAIPVFLSDYTQLTTAQQVFIEVFPIDVHYLSALKNNLPSINSTQCKPSKQWLIELSEETKNELLTLVIDGRASLAKQQLQSLSRQNNNSIEILTLESNKLHLFYQQVKQQENSKQQIEIKKQQAARDQLRKNHLKTIYQEKEQYWCKASISADEGNSRGYEQAVNFLKDLCESYQHQNNKIAFSEKMALFTLKYQRKSSLIKRLKQQGLIG